MYGDMSDGTEAHVALTCVYMYDDMTDATGTHVHTYMRAWVRLY